MGCGGGGGFSGVPSNVAQWEKVSFTHLDFQAAALQNDIEAFSLLARQVPHGFVLVPTIQAAGTGITNYFVSIGLVGALEKWVLKFDSVVVPGNTVFAPGGPYLDPQNLGAAVSVRISAEAVGANLDQSTAGAWDLHFLRSTMLA